MANSVEVLEMLCRLSKLNSLSTLFCTLRAVNQALYITNSVEALEVRCWLSKLDIGGES